MISKLTSIILTHNLYDMKLTDFLKKYQVSESDSVLALKVYGDVKTDEKTWKKRLEKSIKLNEPIVENKNKKEVQ